MDYERSHVEMCAVVISFANIYICASFFRTFHKYKTYRCQLACCSFRCVVPRDRYGAEAYVAAFLQVGPIYHAATLYIKFVGLFDSDYAGQPQKKGKPSASKASELGNESPCELC